MEKIINICGKNKTLKAAGKLCAIYEAQFDKPYFKVQGDLICAMSKAKTEAEQYAAAASVRTLDLYQLIWSMEKLANPETPVWDDWLDELEDPLSLDSVIEVINLLYINNKTNSKIKNASAAAN